ncbi:HEAT repeat domain-containing protein, partial [bacterium]|nr:HEAT repeat domain-containing protein [bacterium]
EVARAALFALGQHGGERAVKLLKEIALDEKADAELRTHAMISLVESDADGLGDVLAQVLRGSKDPEVQQACLYALSEVDDEVPDQVYLEIIRNPANDDGMRAHALHFAAERGTVGVDFVREVYKAADSPDLKTQCCWVLSEMGGKDALKALKDIVREEKNPEVRRQALFWIGEFDSDEAAAFLLEIINDGGKR